MKKFLLIPVLAAVAPFASAGVVNGSFEVPNYGSGWGPSLTDGVAGGWFAEVDMIEIGAGSVYGTTGYTGNQVLELDAYANAKVSQNLTTAVGANVITFDSAARSGVALSSQGVDVLWNDVVVASYNPATTAFSSFSVVVTGDGSDKLSFVGTGTSDSYGTLIDNVDVQAVPEPMTMVVIAGGVAAMLRRRRK
jgi:hypothetical protein